MKKIHSLILVFVSITILFSSCNKTNTAKLAENTTAASAGTATPYKEKTESEIKEKTEKPEENKTTEPGIKETKPEETKIRHISIGTETGYTDEKHQINIIGFKSYKKLESKLYKDHAGKNKKYIVLFLEITNKTIDKDYINVNYLSARLDGKKIKNTVLFNDPEEFQTIFKNIEPGNTLKGFIAWEVPENWKKLEIKYGGWKYIDNFNLDCILTPDDYFDPPQYN